MPDSDASLLADLTPPQVEAVTHMAGPMLVVAGAGSGKTRVVTRRVANLIAHGVPPWRILALTFTNKAAREMRDRVEKIVGQAPSWMGTFHSICARILRADIHLLDSGRDGRFTILDTGDQEGLVKEAAKRLGVDDKAHRPSAILAAISRAKSDFVTPGECPELTPRDRVVRDVYAAYESSLQRNNALDFDDLLVQTARLLDGLPDIRQKYQSRFPFILVDEYQDTNRAQYRLLRALAGTQANIHATGDPDQSIYSWRGADYQNIMAFQRDFPGARIVRLEENYRSGKFILAAANHLIRHNTNRIDKDLFTSRPGGEQVAVTRLQTDRLEAEWIVRTIAGRRAAGESLGEMAVFYRTNAQSRPLEEALMSAGIAYQLIGGVRFYERKEIKDLLAHLKLRINPRDAVSLRRVVDSRPGIGARTLEKITEAAGSAGLSAFEFLALPDFAARFKAGKSVPAFAAWCRGLAAIDASRADVAVKAILAHSGLVATVLAGAARDERADERVENLDALAGRAGDFVRLRLEGTIAADPEAGEGEEEAATAVDLAAFLEDVALVADVDSMADGGEKVTLMTLHSAKGLEFDNVFLSGLEEGVLPHKNCTTDAAVEEERRLFYVGLTRARQRAWVTHAAARFLRGTVDFSSPSRFLEELPDAAVTREDYGDSLSGEWAGGAFGAGAFGLGSSGGKAVLTVQRKGWGGRAADGGGFGDEAADDFLDVGADFDPNPDFEPDLDFDSDTAFAADADFEATPAASGGLPRRRPAPGWGLAVGQRTKPPSAAAAASAFRPGDLVRHPAFGSGKVLTSGKGKIMVQFFASGTRLLHADLSQLTRE